MQKRVFKKPRFSVDRTRRGDLAEQIATGLRTAIETGYYRAGDILPPVRDLADILGVSMGIAVQAVSKIREEGLISPRPAVGSVVCAKDRPLWKGQVLIIVPGGDAIRYETMIAGVVRDALTDAGYLPLMAAVRNMESGNPDFGMLETQMRQQIDLVVQIVGTKEVRDWLSRKNVPFISFTFLRHKVKGCVGLVCRRWDRATPSLVAHCLETGVKKVIVFSAWVNRLGVVDALRRTGVDAVEWRIARPVGVPGVKIVSDIAMEAFARRFACERRRWLPDLIVFADDYLATGALQALLAEGIRIPGDVSIVTFANRWDGPVFTKPFTRMEVDALADGQVLANGVLEYLRGGRFPANAEVGPSYIRGDTF